MHEPSEFEIVSLGGVDKVPEFRLAISIIRSDFETWLVSSKSYSTVHKALMELTGPETFFVDVGANIGSVLCPVVANGSSAAALEPVPSNYLRLLASIDANKFDNVCAFNVGASNANRAAKIVEQGPNSHLGDGGSQTIVTVRLDTLFDICLGRQSQGKQLVLKVDVEGHEPEVFEGAENLLRDRRPILCFESIAIEGRDSPTARMLTLKRKLQAAGYKLFQLLEEAFYAADAEFPQLEHVCDYIAIPTEMREILHAPSIISGPMPIADMAKTLARMATFPVKYHRMHAAGTLKRLQGTLQSEFDIAAVIDKLRSDEDAEVATAAKTHFG